MDFIRQLPLHVYVTGTIAFLVFYRKYGGYRFRCFIMLVLLCIMASYGLIASLILPLFGKAGLINYSVSRGFYYLGSFFTGVTCKVTGEEHITSTPAVYVCNHQTSVDILLMGKVYPKDTSIVAKKEIKYYPFLGWFMILSNAIFLDRKNRANALKEARQAAENIHKKKISVWLFPEGTRGHSSEVDLLPFKKGAFHMAIQARVPIIPVVIANYNDVYSSKEKRFVPGNVNIKVLPPVPTTDVNEDSASVDQLCTSVRESMLTALREISPSNKKD
ncbi:hypothetical protein BJ944DRAFT_266650 [Cunninghamella echinulata]|nr:hypothetical protein BJ944DRAFT_266650 [Cunninghamella echinulata]